MCETDDVVMQFLFYKFFRIEQSHSHYKKIFTVGIPNSLILHDYLNLFYVNCVTVKKELS